MANNRNSHKLTKDTIRGMIARNIKAARMSLQPPMTLESVGELFDPPLTRAAVHQWELGSTLPDVDRLAVLSKRFGCTIDSLVFGDDSNGKELPPEALNLWSLYLRLNSAQREQFALFLRAFNVAPTKRR